MTTSHHPALADVKSRVDQVREEVVAVRRDLHAHPELGWHEVRTTEVLRQRLTAAGLSPQVLPTGTGLICDIGSGDTCVALRADIDALPVPDAVDAPGARVSTESPTPAGTTYTRPLCWAPVSCWPGWRRTGCSTGGCG